MLITISGPDGVGKSTYLKEITKIFEENHINYDIVYIRGNQTKIYRFFKKILSLIIKKDIKKYKTLVKICLILATLELIYTICVKIKRKLKHKQIIICDRYIWDTYVDWIVGFPDIKFEGVFWKYLVKHMTRPAVSLLYTANKYTISKRIASKNEIADMLLINAQLQKYEEISKNFTYVINADTSVDYVVNSSVEKLRLYKGIIGNTFYFSNKFYLKIKKIFSIESETVIDIQPLNLGNSTSKNFLLIVDDKKYFLKIYYNKVKYLEALSGKNEFCIKIYGNFKIKVNVYCIITNWINKIKFDYTDQNVSMVANILKELHSIQCNKIINKKSIKKELAKYKQYFFFRRINFPYKKDILRYLDESIESIDKLPCSLVHMDVHLRNLICDQNNKLYLIDYENVDVSYSWRDLVYAYYFHLPEEHDFWTNVVNEYFSNKIPSNFYFAIKVFCCLHLLRMIICEYQKKNYLEIEKLAYSYWNDFKD